MQWSRYTLAVCAMFSLGVQAAGFTLSSPDIRQGQPMPKAQEANVFGCNGANRSPELRWSGVPAGTQSLAITVYDPDAPTGSGWWHWVVVNLPADLTALPAGIGQGASLPAGAREIRTDSGEPGFTGACPPVGHKVHHYIFTVWALKAAHLDLPDNATAAMAGFNLHAQALGSAQLTATYQRR